MSHPPHWNADRNTRWAALDEGDPASIVRSLLANFPYRVPVLTEHDAVEVDAWTEGSFAIGAIGEVPGEPGHYYWTDGTWSWVRTAGELTYVFQDPHEAMAFKMRWG